MTLPAFPFTCGMWQDAYEDPALIILKADGNLVFMVESLENIKEIREAITMRSVDMSVDLC